MTIRQRKPIKRSSWLARSKRALQKRKGVPKINRAKQAKKLAKYQAFMRSPEWRVIRAAALERAGHQCEASFTLVVDWPANTERHLIRCSRKTGLHVHHVRYTRFGGRELPRDLKVLCKAHHDALHALKGSQMLWQKVAS